MASEDAVAQGAELFAAVCSGCHGPAGDGSIGQAPALDALDHAWHHPDAQLREWISKGKPGLGTTMPAYGDALRDDGVEAVLHYVRSLWTEEQRRAQQEVSARYEEGLRRIQEFAPPTAPAP